MLLSPAARQREEKREKGVRRGETEEETAVRQLILEVSMLTQGCTAFAPLLASRIRSERQG